MGHCLFLRKGEVHTAPVTGVLASSLAVGSTVKLMEDGTAVEYLVVNQGIPENSNLYDASCDGTWLLRKDIHSNRKWHTSDANKYETSAINTWLNGTFFNSLGTTEQAVIKQVKLPYRKNGGYGGTDQSGANGLSCKVFLLSGPEVGLAGASYMPNDGAKLDYFNADLGTDSKRIAYLNGSAAYWWLRSPRTNGLNGVLIIYPNGGYSASSIPGSNGGIRPALVLPSNALFDKTTKLLMGVK